MWDFNAAKRRGLVKEIYLPLQWCVARVGVGCGLGNGLKNGMIAMKRGIKIALITLGSLVGLLLVLAIVLPVFFKPQLLRLAQQEISKRVEADVTIGDLHLSLFKAFPRLYVGCLLYTSDAADEYVPPRLAVDVSNEVVPHRLARDLGVAALGSGLLPCGFLVR